MSLRPLPRVKSAGMNGDQERTERASIAQGERSRGPCTSSLSRADNGRMKLHKGSFTPRVLSKEDLREIRRKVGAPWHDRRRRIPVWKIKALRQCGYSYRQVGRVFNVSGSTIRRRIREHDVSRLARKNRHNSRGHDKDHAKLGG